MQIHICLQRNCPHVPPRRQGRRVCRDLLRVISKPEGVVERVNQAQPGSVWDLGYLFKGDKPPRPEIVGRPHSGDLSLYKLILMVSSRSDQHNLDEHIHPPSSQPCISTHTHIQSEKDITYTSLLTPTGTLQEYSEQSNVSTETRKDVRQGDTSM